MSSTRRKPSPLTDVQRLARTLRDLGPAAGLQEIAEALAAALATSVMVMGRTRHVLTYVAKRRASLPEG